MDLTISADEIVEAAQAAGVPGPSSEEQWSTVRRFAEALSRAVAELPARVLIAKDGLGRAVATNAAFIMIAECPPDDPWLQEQARWMRPHVRHEPWMPDGGMDAIEVVDYLSQLGQFAVDQRFDTGAAGLCRIESPAVVETMEGLLPGYEGTLTDLAKAATALA